MVVSTSIGCSYNVPGESISLSDTTLSEELSEERLIASTDGSDEVYLVHFPVYSLSYKAVFC